MRHSEIIRKATELGRLHGFVTFDQLNELFPSDKDMMAPEEIEAIFEALSAEGINVVEGS